jgi:hypothetical protein
MIGRKWILAEGFISNSRSAQMKLPGRREIERVAVYNVLVRMPDGEEFEAEVATHRYRGLRIGTRVRLDVSAATGEIRIHELGGHPVISRGHGPLSVREQSSAWTDADDWSQAGAFASPRGGRDGAESIRPGPAARIEALQQMLELGHLSQADFEAKRQRILNSM